MTNAGDGTPMPAVALGIEVTPAGANKAQAGLNLIDRLTQAGRTISSIVVDRGYSMAKPENWATPLIRRNIEQHHDLGANEKRLEPADTPGVIFLDGHPYLANMPKRLRELRRLGLGATNEEVAENARAYNERVPWGFARNGRPTRTGAQRYRGPIHAQKVRCPNYPWSLRWPETKPLTNCIPGEPCACAATFTIQADDPRVKHRQPELFGTEHWLKRYGARNLAESFNASLKQHHMKLKRQSSRVFGLMKNTIMLGFIVAATNINILRMRYGWDEGRPELMPPRDKPLKPLPQDSEKDSNARPPSHGVRKLHLMRLPARSHGLTCSGADEQPHVNREAENASH